MPDPSTERRLTIPEYAMALAHVASLRSEDPFRKVGAVAIDFDNRVIGTAYNGLAPGYNADPSFWSDRDARRKYMLHAEVNLCSLFTRGNVKLVACTTMPCTSCMQMLCAYGVREVYYRDAYPESQAEAICARYGIHLEQMTHHLELLRLHALEQESS
jgi:dCMP deaminase